MDRKLILYIAMSLDGFIAKKDGNINFLNIVDYPNEDYGYNEFLETVDTIIWGRKTYDKVLSFGNGIPHKNKKIYVISKTRKGKDDNIEYIDDLIKLVHDLKKSPGKDIYCDGGSEIAFELFRNRLFDRIIISIIPFLLGDGIRLFKEMTIEQHIYLKKSITYPSGLVQLWYDVK